jgi:hypothetical protein
MKVDYVSESEIRIIEQNSRSVIREALKGKEGLSVKEAIILANQANPYYPDGVAYRIYKGCVERRFGRSKPQVFQQLELGGG